MSDLVRIFLGEMFGTMVLIILGNGVVANVLYKKTGGSGGGIITIAFGWGFAVFCGVLVANAFGGNGEGSGGHLNPAVTMGVWVSGGMGIGKAFIYFGSEMLGAIIGSIIVTVFYWQHAQEDENKDAILSTHSTGPTHKDKIFSNLFSEFVGTFILVAMALTLVFAFKSNRNPAMEGIMGFAGPLTMGFVVFVIGVSLGGTTGYAINPARDFGPRLVYQFTPYKNKSSAQWSYAWIPVVAPLAAGAVMGAFARLF